MGDSNSCHSLESQKTETERKKFKAYVTYDRFVISFTKKFEIASSIVRAVEGMVTFPFDDALASPPK